MRFLIFTGTNKVFHLHLFKLTRAKDKVARSYFVAKRFSDLCDTKRKLASAGCQHVNKINEDSLGGFGTQVNERRLIFLGCCADMRSEHEVERARIRQIRRA